jgi:diguanylate cyclase (GGDEF)-like protein
MMIVVNHFPIIGTIALFPFWWLGWQYDKAKFYSEKDGLTSCYNRRYIHSIIPKLFKKSDKNHIKLSVTIIDVNKFKRINDEFGHDVGDQVLVQIAEVLHRICLTSSIVSRWGGDEFMLISTRFGKEAELEQFLGEFNEQLSHGLIPNITCSYGSSFRHSDGQSFEELYNKADERMYQMKVVGRNANGSM